MTRYPREAFMALTAVVLVGTAYSVLFNTYLDTSNPLLTHLPHPLHKTHYFASKANVINVLFTKKLWAWTSGAFLFLFFTSPPRLQQKERLYKYATETLLWLLFTGWFFGPSLMDRLTVSTGGECVVNLPSGAVVSVPETFCYTKSTISPRTHPGLFAASLLVPSETWSQVPRIRRGHDVSGHLFLLTMTILFLVEQLELSVKYLQSGDRSQKKASTYHLVAVISAIVVVALAFFASWTTSVYFHTPLEKFTGFLLGVAGYSITRLPFLQEAAANPIRQTSS